MARFVNIDLLIREMLPCFSKGHIYNLVSQNEIPHIKKGGKLAFDIEAVAEWMRDDANGVKDSEFRNVPPWETKSK